MKLLAGISKNIQDHQLFQPGESLMIAVSGGLDSVALFQALIELQRKWKWKLAVAHFNHRLRGTDSDRDEAFVANLAIENAIPCISGRGDVLQAAKIEKISVEMAARKLRHRFLADAARLFGIKKIVLAHTLDDQNELFFLRLLRGAGAGLAGMQWQNRSFVDPAIILSRPILTVPKSILKAYLQQNRHSWREDQSNNDLAIPRNWIRHKLIPSLRQRFPGFETSLAKTTEIIRDEKEFIQNCAHDFDRTKEMNFYQIPPALQRELLRHQLHQYDLDETYDLVEALRSKRDVRISISPGRFAQRNTKGVLKVTESVEPGFDDSKVLSIDLKGRVGAFSFGETRCNWEVERCSASRPRAGLRTEYFDAAKVGVRVQVRHWRQGDRFQPIGMRDQIKLHDFFINQKISRARRHQLVVATAENGEIFWVEECRISERFKLDKTSRRRLKWAWHRDSACG